MKKIALQLLKYTVVLSFLLSFHSGASAQVACQLTKGDILITGYDMADDQTDGSIRDDRFSFVNLKAIKSGQVIYFTDLGYMNGSSSFQSSQNAKSDGVIKWTADKDYPEATEFIINCKFTLKATLKDNTTSAGTVSGILESYTTRVSFPNDPKEYMSLADFSGDQIFAFTVPPTNVVGDYTTGITFLAGISANTISGGWSNTLSNSSVDAANSELPANLASNAQNLAVVYNNLADTDFINDAFAARHKNKITGPAATILTNINQLSNWEFSSKLYSDVNFTPFVNNDNYGLPELSLATLADRTNICSGTATSFAIVAQNACSFQWQMKTPTGSYANLSDGGVFSNVTTASLNISSVNGLNGNTFRVLVRGNGGVATSNDAMLTVVNPLITFATTSLPDGKLNSVYPTQTVAIASGGVAPVSFSIVSGSLPAGMSLSTSGILAGTPTAQGTFNFTIGATAGCNSAGSQALTLIVRSIILSSTNPLAATVGQAYSANLSATGGTAPYSYSVSSGALPAGLTLSSAGVISGTPTAGGTFNFTARATDANTGSGTAAYSLTVNAPTIAITPTTLPLATTRVAYSQVISASGGSSPYTYSVVSGALPAGITLAANGTLAGSTTTAGTFNFTVKATDGSTGTGPYSNQINYSLTVNSPSITLFATSPPGATRNVAYIQVFTATGGIPPYSFAVTSGALPSGLALAANGTISGTPVSSGTFNYSLTATDANGNSGTGAITLIIEAPSLAISPLTLANSVAGASYSNTFNTTGGTSPYSYSISSGALPAGLTLSTTGVLSGTPTTSAISTFTVRATDASSAASGGPYTITKNYNIFSSPPAITIANTTLSPAIAGQSYSAAISASGGTAPYRYSITSGNLPAGLTLNANGNVTGIPTASGTFNFTVLAGDATTGGTFTTSVPMSMSVSPPTIVIAPVALANATVATPYNQSITATGGTANYSYAVSAGALPTGLSFTSAGILSGTPTAGGTFSFTLTATDATTGNGPYTGSRAYTVSVGAPTLALSPATLPNGTVAAAYSQALTTAGGTAAYTYAVSAGALPAGLSLSSSGMLSGTPTAGGIFNFTITSTDNSTGSGPYSASRAYSLTIAAPVISLTPATLPAGTVATAYSQTLTATGGTAGYTYALTAGVLPAGLSLNSAGVLSGTPGAAGNFAFTITATDSSTGLSPYSGSRSYTISIAAPIILIAPASLPNPVIGQAYSQLISASGGTSGYSYAVTAGVLPAGLSLSSSGTLSGTATTAGSFTFTIRASDGSIGGPYTGARAYAISVGAPTMALSPSTLPTPVIGNIFSQNFTTSGATAPYTYAIASGNLPTGLTLNSSTGEISGTPSISGAFNFTLRATDSSTGSGAPFSVSNNYSGTIAAAPKINSATFNASTGVLLVNGLDFGTGSTVDVSKLTVVANGISYALTSENVSTISPTQFSVSLNNADQLNVMFDQNGTQGTDAIGYKLISQSAWLNNAAANTAGVGLTVTNFIVPSINSVSYDVATGILSASGAGFKAFAGSENDVTASKLYLTSEGLSYTLSSADVDFATPQAFTVTLNNTDRKALIPILNKSGISAANGSPYNTTASLGWMKSSPANTKATIPTTVNNVAIPVVTSSSYDGNNGVLTLNGTGLLRRSGIANDVISNHITFTGQGNQVYTLTNTGNADISSDTQALIVLSNVDKAAVKALINKNGSTAVDGTSYKLTAAAGWSGANPTAISNNIPLTALNAKSNIFALSALSTTAGSLSATFSPSALSYNVASTSGTASASLTATLQDASGSMELKINNSGFTALANGQASPALPLNFGDNLVQIKVTAEDGGTNTYSVTINRPNAPQIITFATSASVPFGTPDFDPGAISATSAVNTISYTSSNLSVATVVSGKIHLIGVGQTKITASQNASLGFDAAAAKEQILTVVKGTAVISLDGLAQSYDGLAKPAIATVNPAVAGLNLSYNSTASVPVNAGTYQVVASLNNPDYTAVDATGDLIIAKKAITISAVAATKTYGDNDPVFGYSVSPALVGNDVFTGALSRAIGTNIGTYSINLGTLSAGNNYNLQLLAADLVIGAKTITGNFTAGNKIYDGSNAAMITGRTLTGVLAADQADVTLTGGTASFANATAATGKTVTSAGMTLSGAKAANYTLSSVNPATADISKKEISGNFTAGNKTYDGNNAALIIGRTLNDVLLADQTDVSLTGGTATFANSNVGNGKTVTSAGMSITGAKALNYNLSGVGATTANITGLALIGNFTSANKIYDGSTAATITGRTLTGVLLSDQADVALTGGTANFANPTAATNKTVTSAGMTLSGTKAANYTLSSVNPGTADISKKDISGNFTADNKVYDGTITATISGRTLSGILLADQTEVSLTGGSATFGNANVENAKTVSSAGMSITGAKALNYNLTGVGATTANITGLSLSGNFTAANKVYDGDTQATITSRTLTGVLAADQAEVSLTGGTATFANATAAAGKTVNSAGMALSGIKAANYTLSSVTPATADISKKDISGNFTAENKMYDGTVTATITSRTLSGVLLADQADVNLIGGTATFANANVENAKSVSSAGMSITGAKALNYNLTGVGATTANITGLSLSGNFTVANKVYDGNTAATITSRTLSGVLLADQADVSLAGGTASFANATAATGKTVTSAGMVLSGTKAANYTLSSVNLATADISKKDISGNFTAENKTYDGNTVAVIIGRTLTGILAADQDEVKLTGGTANFANSSVENGKAVSSVGMSITGAKALNYNLTGIATATANITGLALTGNFTAGNKTYDGNTAAMITSRTLSGVLLADQAEVSLTGGTAIFDNANAATGKTVTSSGMVLSGTKSANYTLSSVNLATADISKKDISGNFTADNKAYDGNPVATINGRTLTGVLAADQADVSLTGGTATFSNANVGTGKTVTSTGMRLSGAKIVNYNLTSVASTTANISLKTLVGAFTAANKVYDGNDNAAVLTRTLTGVLTADLAEVNLTGGSANFQDVNVGTGKTLVATGMVLSGSKAANYSLSSVSNAAANITAKPVTGGFTASNKVYDGATNAAILTRTLTGVLTADQADVNLSGGTASFADRNIGAAKVVTSAAMSLSGAKASNYSLSSVATTLASITARPIVISADAKTKVYGAADPALTYTILAPALVTGDLMSGNLSRTSGENAGLYAIGQNTLTAGTNYIITYNTANLEVTKKALVITADNKSKNYLAPNPALTASYSGFAGTETPSVLTTPVALSTTATISSVAGSYPISASGAAAANYSISYVAGVLSVNASSQSITFDALANKLSTDGTFTLTATASSGLAVSYTSSNPNIARIINGNQLEILRAGVINITASQAGNASYLAATSVVQPFTIIDNPAPLLTITSNKGNSVSKGETAQLTATGAVRYEWRNANGVISGQNTATLTVRPSQNTTYTLTGFNQYGRSSTQSFTLDVRADYQVVNIMNVLTPNGDGKNDKWIVENIDMYPNNIVKVFDRAGKTVFEMKTYNNSWDGTFRGNVLPEGAYYYIIDFGTGIGVRKGYITIVGNN